MAASYGRCEKSKVRSYQPSSKVVVSPFIPTSSVWRFHPPQRLVWSLFLMLAILSGLLWYFIAVLIYISWLTNDTDHLFMTLFAICKTSWMKHLFKKFAHSFINVSIPYLTHQGFSMLWIQVFYQLNDLQIFFSQTVACLFILSAVCLEE